MTEVDRRCYGWSCAEQPPPCLHHSVLSQALQCSWAAPQIYLLGSTRTQCLFELLIYYFINFQGTVDQYWQKWCGGVLVCEACSSSSGHWWNTSPPPPPVLPSCFQSEQCQQMQESSLECDHQIVPSLHQTGIFFAEWKTIHQIKFTVFIKLFSQLKYIDVGYYNFYNFR